MPQTMYSGQVVTSPLQSGSPYSSVSSASPDGHIYSPTHYDHHPSTHQMPMTSSGMMSSPHQGGQIGSPPQQQHYHSPSPYKQEIHSPGEYSAQPANVEYIHPSGSPPYHHPPSVVPSTAASIPHLIPYTNVSTTPCTSGLTTYFDVMTGEPAIYTMPGTHPHMSMVDSFTVQSHQLPPFTHAFEGAMVSHNGQITDQHSQSGLPLAIKHVRNDYGVTGIEYYHPPSPQMTVEGHPPTMMYHHPDMCSGTSPIPPDLCSGLTPLPSHLCPMPTIRPRKSKTHTHTSSIRTLYCRR